jgi:hypothetical protein
MEKTTVGDFPLPDLPKLSTCILSPFIHPQNGDKHRVQATIMASSSTLPTPSEH